MQKPAGSSGVSYGVSEVFIDRLRIEAMIGLWEWEKKSPRPLLISVRCYTDPECSHAEDDSIIFAPEGWKTNNDLRKIICYDAIASHIARIAKRQIHTELIETFGEIILHDLMQDYRIRRVVLTIDKPQAVPNTAGTGIVMEGKRDGPDFCSR